MSRKARALCGQCYAGGCMHMCDELRPEGPLAHIMALTVTCKLLSSNQVYRPGSSWSIITRRALTMPESSQGVESGGLRSCWQLRVYHLPQGAHKVTRWKRKPRASRNCPVRGSRASPHPVTQSPTEHHRALMNPGHHPARSKRGHGPESPPGHCLR